MNIFEGYKQQILDTHNLSQRQRILAEAFADARLSAEERERLVEMASPDAA